MAQTAKREYSYDEFLKTFFSSNGGDLNKPETPFEIGVFISQSALAIMKKSIRESLNPSPRKTKISPE